MAAGTDRQPARRREAAGSALDHPAAEERRQRGREARESAPREAHGEWTPARNRADPIEILDAQASTRVPELVPIRYGRMSVSPFTFYRGAAAVMAADLASDASRVDSGIRVQACGDAHVSNFGAFAAPDRRLVFDLNDFDETLPGPWEWDLKRLAASIEIAGRNRGFKRRLRREMVVAAAAEYRTAMREFAAMGNLDVWYARLSLDEVFATLEKELPADAAGVMRKAAAKATAKDSLRALNRLTREVDGRLQFDSRPPLLVPMRELLPDGDAGELESSIRDLLRAYRNTLSSDRRHLLESYEFVDIAHKVVGVGSVGTRAWIILLTGRDGTDPLVLQAKEAQASVLERHVGASEFENHGERVVAGQRIMQAASDSFLGWERVEGIDGKQRDFYVRQLWDGKGAADLDVIRPEGLMLYVKACGWTLARAHARSGDRIAIAAYAGKRSTLDEAIADFSAAYADQNERDHQALLDAIASGRIEAADDPK